MSYTQAIAPLLGITSSIDENSNALIEEGVTAQIAAFQPPEPVDPEKISPSTKSLADISERELIALCKAELPETSHAYQELVNRYWSMTYSICMRNLGSNSDSEEVCQDAWVRVFRAIGDFEEKCAFKTWLYHIINNLCIDRKRKLASDKEKTRKFTELVVHCIGRTQEIEIDVRATVETVRVALERLAPAQRDILSLRFFSDLSLNEIAQERGIKLSATKMRLSRALEAFKTVYADTVATPA